MSCLTLHWPKHNWGSRARYRRVWDVHILPTAAAVVWSFAGRQWDARFEWTLAGSLRTGDQLPRLTLEFAAQSEGRGGEGWQVKKGRTNVSITPSVQKDVNPKKCFDQKLTLDLLHFTYFYIWSVLFVPRRIPWNSHSFNHEGLMMRSLCRKMGWSRTGWAFLDISGVRFLQHAFDKSELSKVSTRLMRSYETIFRSKVFCLAFCAVS